MTMKTINERQKMAPQFFTFGKGSPVYHIAQDLSSWWHDAERGEWRLSTGVSTLALQAAIGRENATFVANPLPNQPLPFVVNGATLNAPQTNEASDFRSHGINAASVTINVASLTINGSLTKD